jgi:hypothetical protein
MIDPATNWFEIEELPTVTQETTVKPGIKVNREHLIKTLR